MIKIQSFPRSNPGTYSPVSGMVKFGSHKKFGRQEFSRSMVGKELDLDEFESSLEVFSRKWQPLILYILLEKGSMSFSELKDRLEDISGKVLSNNLENLVEKEFIEKEVLSEKPKRVRYSVNSKSKGLKPVLEELKDWNKARNQENVKKILVVDDEEKLVDLYSRWLDERFEVDTANSGEEALDKLERETDLVVLDRVMPGISGKETLERIRNVSDCGVVMVTAKEPELEVADMEVDDYLLKPVDRSEILSKAEEILEDDSERGLKSLKARKELLEEHFSASRLEESDEYVELVEEIQNLED